MKTMCPPGYHNDGFCDMELLSDLRTLRVVDHFWQLIYIYILIYIYFFIHICIYIIYIYIYIYIYVRNSKRYAIVL